jgi:hypothetical protein
MKYVLYLKDKESFNRTKIECFDAKELAKYAAAAIKQGYKEVKAVVESEVE